MILIRPDVTAPLPRATNKPVDPILKTMLLQRPCAIQPQQQQESNVLQAMNRNNRKPKRANKGARPCSRVSRRAKRRAPGNWRR